MLKSPFHVPNYGTDRVGIGWDYYLIGSSCTFEKDPGLHLASVMIVCWAGGAGRDTQGELAHKAYKKGVVRREMHT